MPRGRVHQHVVSEVNEQERSAVCALCGPVVVQLHNRRGVKLWVCARRPAGVDGRGRKRDHELTDVDPVSRTGSCAMCGPVRVYVADGARAQQDVDWVCGRRPPQRGAGGHTTHIVEVTDEVQRLGMCKVCGPVHLIWRPYLSGGGRWGCERTRFSIGSAHRYDENYKPAICPYCQRGHRWDRNQGRTCKARLVADLGNHCAVCKETPTDSLRVDHDHQTGAVRGLLCRNCNVALGLLKDSHDRVRTLLDYLESK